MSKFVHIAVTQHTNVLVEVESDDIDSLNNAMQLAEDSVMGDVYGTEIVIITDEEPYGSFDDRIYLEDQ